MNENKLKHHILCIDDDQDILNLAKRYLIDSGFRVSTANNGVKGLEMIKEENPSLVLLDIIMPELDGYKVCAQLQQDSETSYIPVIFVTSLGYEQNKVRAFSAGAVDYIVKPFKKEILLEKVNAQLKKTEEWKKLKDSHSCNDNAEPFDFVGFKGFLVSQLQLPDNDMERLVNLKLSKMYEMGLTIGIKEDTMAEHIAKFTKLPYISYINPDEIHLGKLPTPFCIANKIVPLKDKDGIESLAVCNPFNIELFDCLKQYACHEPTCKIVVTAPNNIKMLGKRPDHKPKENILDIQGVEKAVMPVKETVLDMYVSRTDIEKHPVVYTTNNIILKAVSERASDIHIEPKEHSVVVRFRVDGVMREFFSLEPKMAVMVISRLKAYAELDIAERRRPQDGSMPIVVNNRKFNFRLATALTPHGESIIIRLLETKAFTKDLNELGMTKEQKNIMVDLGKRTQGLILFVGQTGSGKTTTIYSLLHQIDCKSRSLISVEDPVEYSIPFANQEQVNEKVGITFEALLKSSVRQDPDILFIGEIRDTLSANTCIDFASTGHLTISSMHTTNATTAIFRLERMDVDRQTMANATIGIVAQKLLRKLCSSCKEVKPISEEESNMLFPFTDNIPTNVAHPVGCLKCGKTGYFGCEGIYEILQIDETMSDMICSGSSILEIRKFVQERGDYLISDHAIEKVKNLIFPLKDVFEAVLADEIKHKTSESKPAVVKTEPVRSKITDSTAGHKTILVIDDDDDSRKLIRAFLEKEGYKTLIAEDGVDALICLDKHAIDLVLSDVNMPGLDGFRLLEIMNQKGIEIPVIFITARTSVEDENTGLKLGAVDYIKKPIQKEILLLRIGNILTEA